MECEIMEWNAVNVHIEKPTTCQSLQKLSLGLQK